MVDADFAVNDRPAVDPAVIDPARFALEGGVTLRPYQERVARAVVESVLQGQGRSLAVMFPRQSGKNEAQAWIEAALLWGLRERGGEIVKISPTFRPQSLNAMRRLERVLQAHPATQGAWKKEQGFIYRIGQARIYFFSGAEESNIVGATASTLLQVDEAQEIGVDKYDREIAPMAASTRATRAFWGTAWTAETLLAREMRVASPMGGAYRVGADEVGAAVPAWRAFLDEQIQRLGRDHPLVRTQYFCEEIETGGRRMFPQERLERMVGATKARGGPYALLLDVGGEALEGDPEPGGPPPRDPPPRDQDQTVATVVAADLRGLSSPARAPIYRPVERRAWDGANHADVFEALLALERRYRFRWVVVDATGVGAGLASFLARNLPGRVIPFLFTQASKSKLGWDFLAVVDAGRWQEPPGLGDAAGARFFRQLEGCEQEVLPGPGQILRWGVPEGRRDKITGGPLHDDLVLSAALCAVLDAQPWSLPSAGVLIQGRDPLR